jgi:multidrug efflux system outer membrane protein
MPTLDFNPEFERQRYTLNQEPSFGSLTATTLRAPFDLSYEVDLWGRVRRALESSRAEAQASAADMHNLLLSIQADVAQNYFSLRASDRQRAIVRLSIQLRREAREILRSRVEAGTAPELDLARADVEVASAEADLARAERLRNNQQIALAILTGNLAPAFAIPELTEPKLLVPVIPPGLPSLLLERRPDIASAERQLAAANARIGVAKAAYFPVLRLTGSAGYVSADLESIFDWESRVWTLGPSLSVPLFSGGRNRANLARARAAHAEAAANYRQQVLVAFGEVQEQLTSLKHLAAEAAAVERTHAASQRTYQQAQARYDGGIVSYLEVIESQRTLLAAELDSIRLHAQRQVASVQLIKALGGGWNTAPNGSGTPTSQTAKKR